MSLPDVLSIIFVKIFNLSGTFFLKIIYVSINLEMQDDQCFKELYKFKKNQQKWYFLN